jgi:hypothetical protein
VGFVNEVAAERDVEKFGLRDSNRKSGLSVGGPYEWTVDRATGTYLRYHSYDREVQGDENFLFCRGGCVDLIVLSSVIGPRGESPRSVTWNFVRRVISAGKPIDDDYLVDLRAALTVYKLGGLHDVQQQYSVVFNF